MAPAPVTFSASGPVAAASWVAAAASAATTPMTAALHLAAATSTRPAAAPVAASSAPVAAAASAAASAASGAAAASAATAPTTAAMPSAAATSTRFPAAAAAASSGLATARPVIRGSKSGALAGVKRLVTDTREKALLASVIRYIFYLAPPVVNKNLCTPALVVPFLASEMSWMVGPVAEGCRECVDGASREVFKNPLSGWLWLCNEFSVCERGLYLTSRVKHEFQFIGQPSSVLCEEIIQGINPTHASQWESRRVVVRSSLDLWNVDLSRPGSPNAVELSKLRQLLSTEEGARQAADAGCVLLPGTEGSNGPATDKSTLLFGWGSTRWVPGSPAATLVEELSPGFFKAVNRTLAAVKDWPVEHSDSAPAAKNDGRIRKRSAAGAAFARAQSPRAPSAAETGRGPVPRAHTHGKRKVTSRRGDVDAAASYVPAPLLLEVPGCIISTVDPCPAWPRGAWATQIPLASFLDTSALGKVSLHVHVTAQAGRGDGGDVQVCSSGIYSYRLVVKQVRLQATDESRALSKFVRAVPGVSERSRSIELLKGVRRVAVNKLKKDNRGIAQLLPHGLLFSQDADSGSPVATGGSPAGPPTTGGTATMEDVVEDVAVVGHADAGATQGSSSGSNTAGGAGAATQGVETAEVGTGTTSGSSAGSPADGGALAATKDVGPPVVVRTGLTNEGGGCSEWDVSNISVNVLNNLAIPSKEFSYSFSFRSDKLLRRKVTHVRDCGRLWVVADVREVEIESPPTSA